MISHLLFALLAQAIVADHRTRKAAIPGIGHPIHKPIDPRTPRLFQLAKEQGYYGTACELMLAIAAEVIGTSCLRLSQGMTRPGPTLLVLAAYGTAPIAAILFTFLSLFTSAFNATFSTNVTAVNLALYANVIDL